MKDETPASSSGETRYFTLDEIRDLNSHNDPENYYACRKKTNEVHILGLVQPHGLDYRFRDKDGNFNPWFELPEKIPAHSTTVVHNMLNRSLVGKLKRESVCTKFGNDLYTLYHNILYGISYISTFFYGTKPNEVTQKISATTEAASALVAEPEKADACVSPSMTFGKPGFY